MADTIEAHFVCVKRTQTGTTITVRLYRCGDPVTVTGFTMIPRTLLQTVTETIGPVNELSRLVEKYRELALTRAGQLGLSEVVCSL